MTRRQKGTGGVREKRSGVFELKFDIGPDPVTGRRRIKYQTVKGTRREAEKELRRLLREVDTGDYAEPSSATVKNLLDRWVAHMRSQVSPKTLERYGQLIDNNIMPVLGHQKLDQLRPHHIDAAWTKLLESGRSDGKGGLSPQTVKHCHRVFKQAIAQAVRWQIISRNPADAVDPPRVTRVPLTVLDMEQTAILLDAIRLTRFYMPVLIAVTTGLRRGEALALRWKDIDLDAGHLSVIRSLEQTKAGLRFKEPKSKRTRQVTLTSLLATNLRCHRVEQAQTLLKLGVRQTGNTLVCCRFDGAAMNPAKLSASFPTVIKNAGLPPVTFQGLRHTHASHLLAGGVHMKVASERLGHSSIGITMDLYSHLLPGLQEEAAEKVDNALQAALKGSSKAT